MKKLKMKAQEMGAVEILTRKQLKNVLGGNTQMPSTNCIMDGEACGIFKFCCNACLATFTCGRI